MDIFLGGRNELGSAEQNRAFVGSNIRSLRKNGEKEIMEIKIKSERYLIVPCNLPETNTTCSLSFAVSNLQEEIGGSVLEDCFSSPEMEEAIRIFLGHQSKYLVNDHPITFDVMLVGSASVNKRCLEDGEFDACWPEGTFMIFGIDADEETDTKEKEQ